jgi:membrane-bound metal-dependent hydrolase YbcI (DUF457 family)
MPTPFGHALAAIAIAHAAAPRSFRVQSARQHGWYYAAAAVLGCVADADLLIDVLRRGEISLHQGPTHSLAIAGLAAVLLFPILKLGRAHRARAVVVAFLCVASHALLDMLRSSSSREAGVRLFWPFSDADVSFPWGLFLHAPSLDEAWDATGLKLLAANLAVEAAVLGLMLVIVVAVKARPALRPR